MDLKDLLLDIGNSSVISCEKRGRDLSQVTIQKTSLFLETLPSFPFRKYRKVVISSVVPKVDEAIQKKCPSAFFITPQTIPLLTLNLKNPEQLGADRVVNALAATISYSLPCLIIDSGTAITGCLVDQTKTYQGGFIFPGMGIASRSLHDYTAKIPFIPMTQKVNMVGKNTQESVQSGLYWGYFYMLEGLIQKFKQDTPNLKVIGTGNGLSIFQDQFSPGLIDIYDPHLILKGLAYCADTL